MIDGGEVKPEGVRELEKPSWLESQQYNIQRVDLKVLQSDGETAHTHLCSCCLKGLGR